MTGTRKRLYHAFGIVALQAAAFALPARAHAGRADICGAPICTSSCAASCAALTDGLCPIDGDCGFDQSCPGGVYKFCD